jgi:hypothetical protein
MITAFTLPLHAARPKASQIIGEYPASAYMNDRRKLAPASRRTN